MLVFVPSRTLKQGGEREEMFRPSLVLGFDLANSLAQPASHTIVVQSSSEKDVGGDGVVVAK